MVDARRLARRLVRTILAGRPPAPAPRTILGLSEIGELPRDALEEACRNVASPAYLGDHVALCRILARYKLYLDTRDVSFGAHVLLDGFWEPWLTRFMARLVKPGFVVADVGANFGYYTLLLADLVGAEGRVFSVEPNPAAAELLKRSVALNGFASRTTVCALAAGSAEGAANLWVPEGNPGHAAIVADQTAPPPDCASRSVAVASLDSLVGAEGRIDFIKIDAEGSEERIIAGMERIFAVQRPLIVLEFNASWYRDAAGFLARLLALYGALRYIDYDGQAVPVSPERLLAANGEWLLFLDPA